MPFDATPLLPTSPDLPTIDPVVRLLEKGLARIERGWCQGASAKDERGQTPLPGKPAVAFCAVGAILYDNSISRYNEPAFRYLVRAINPNYHTAMTIPVWNDFPHRTQDDVIRVFRRAIKIAKAEVFENAV
jgi:hypothetical protein